MPRELCDSLDIWAIRVTVKYTGTPQRCIANFAALFTYAISYYKWISRNFQWKITKNVKFRKDLVPAQDSEILTCLLTYLLKGLPWKIQDGVSPYFEWPSADVQDYQDSTLASISMYETSE